MATTLLNCEIILSKQLGDYWSSSTTSAGTDTTMIDTALKAKTNDWIDGDREMYVFLIEEPTGNAAIYDERKISSLDNSTGTLTTLAFLAAPGTGIDYEINRNKAKVVIGVSDENFEDIVYRNTDDRRPRWKRFCSRLRNDECNKKIRLNEGANLIEFMVLDEAGNSIGKSLEIIL